MNSAGRIWVLDTSALIELKGLIGVSEQWNAFKRLEELVIKGAIAMPRQVINEAAETAHPDLPGVWAPGVRDRLIHPLDVDYVYVQRVMDQAGEVVDPNKAREDADAYVAGLALQLQEAGSRVAVVTQDQVDHVPIRIALTTACRRLGIHHVDARTFLLDCGIKVKLQKVP